MSMDAGGAQSVQRLVVSDDPSWVTGPPYAVSGEGFDEDAIVMCKRVAEHIGAD